MRKKPISPCYKCEERQLGCHSSCEKYKQYAGIVEEERQARYELNEQKYGLISKRREKERAKLKGEK